MKGSKQRELLDWTFNIITTTTTTTTKKIQRNLALE